MNLQKLKYDFVERLSQIITFNDKGVILESDDTIVPAKGSDLNIFEDTLFCGMEDLLMGLSIRETLTFDCINADLFGKTSYFDLIVQRIEEDKFALIMCDFGDQYNKIFELQQERNLAEIQAKKAQREVSKVKEEKETLEKLYQDLLEGQSSQFILVKADNLLINLDLSDINYLEAYGDYIKVHTSGKVYVTYNTMKNMESSLPENQFFRIHRSYMIRLDKVVNIEQLSVLIGEKNLPIGKAYKSALIEKLGQL